MKFTKEPPYDLGKLACIVNAIIKVLKLKVEKISKVEIGKVNNALVQIGFGYQPSTNLGNQWTQLVDMMDQMDLDSKTRKEILKLAKKKHEHLRINRELI